MTVPYHSHKFEIPTADKNDILAGAAHDKVVVPAVLGSAAAVDKEFFATAEQGVKADNAVPCARQIYAGAGLSGGGALTRDITLALAAEKQQAIDAAAAAATAAEQKAEKAFSAAEQGNARAEKAEDAAAQAVRKAAAAGDVFRKDLGALAFKSAAGVYDINASGVRNSGTVLYGDGVWRAVPQSGGGTGGGSGGDMYKALYDPRGRQADVFDMDNMIEGRSNKILSAADKAKLQAAPADIIGKTAAKTLIDASVSAYIDPKEKKLQADVTEVKQTANSAADAAAAAKSQAWSLSGDINGINIKLKDMKIAADIVSDKSDKAAAAAKTAGESADKAAALANAAGDVRKSQLGGLAFKDSVQVSDIAASGSRGEGYFLQGDGHWAKPYNDIWDNTFPAGMIMLFCSPYLPGGWLECDGSWLNIDEYQTLYGATEGVHGEDLTKNIFRIPDLRGEFVRGYDNGRGLDKDREFGTVQTDAVQNAKGEVTTESLPNVPQSIIGNAGGVFSVSEAAANYYPLRAPDQAKTGRTGFNFDLSKAVRTAEETRPRNVALTYAIKY